MTFLTTYSLWFETHLRRRRGERRRRLEEGHGYAQRLFLEQVWYSAFRQFDDLHPEFEVADFRDGVRFIDFAFIRFPLRLAIEIDGYGTHSSKLSRSQFSDSLMRQNYLIIDGWKILRFSYDDVNERPRMCKQILQQFMGSRIGAKQTGNSASDILEKEVLRYALLSERNLRTPDVREFLRITKVRASQLLHSMVSKRTLLPAGEGEKRIRRYKANHDVIDERNW